MPYIYTINCPLTGQVKYVGKSNEPIKRFKSHLQSAKSGSHKNIQLYNWINHILEEGFNPVFNIIDQAEFGRPIFDLEAKYIRHFWGSSMILNKSLPHFKHEDVDYENLRIICKLKKIKYKEVACHLGVSHSSVAGYLIGQKCQLSHENAKRMEKYILYIIN